MPRGLTGYLFVLLIMNIEYSNEVPKSQREVLQKNKNKMIGKIVGGSPVLMEHFPSMVQLYNLGNMCAGNILNSWTVLTSAHCFDLNQNVQEIVIQVGWYFNYKVFIKIIYLRILRETKKQINEINIRNYSTNI